MLYYKRVYDDAAYLGQPKPGDAGYDIPIYGNVTIQQNSVAIVSTGIAVEIPEGFVGIIAGRSGNAFREHIYVHHNGIIDSGYRGEIKIILRNENPYSVHISHGSRIAQLVIVPYFEATVMEVSNLSPSQRGIKGFGSSGTVVER